MKVKLLIGCACGEVNTLSATAGKELPDITCGRCAATIYGCGHLRVSDGVLSRSQDEIEAGEHALAIIFAAMAIECELAGLFFRWRR